MFRARDSWFRVLNRFKLSETRRAFSGKPISTGSGDKAESNLTKYDESYRQLGNLDFMTAAKILFTDPPKKKTFGIDFHLVQLFFALMPSFGIPILLALIHNVFYVDLSIGFGAAILTNPSPVTAVYLVAQYARYEMRKMEEELGQKKKKEEEEKAKAKELELTATEEKEAGPVQELSEVKTRLYKLEETVKEIVVEAKKQSGSGVVKNQEATEASSSGSTSESRTSTEKDPLSRHNSPEQRLLGEGKAREKNQKGGGKDGGIPQ